MCVLIQEVWDLSIHFFLVQGLVKTFPAVEDRNKAGYSLRIFLHFVLDLAWQWGGVIYGKHHIQHKAAVSYVCVFIEITFISKPEGWWENFSQRPYSMSYKKEGKNPT